MEKTPKPLTFTLQLAGLQLSDDDRRDISEALNDTLMRKLGGLKLQHESAPNQAEAASAGTLVSQVIRIDGGAIEKLLSKKDFFTTVGKSALENVVKASFLQLPGQ